MLEQIQIMILLGEQVELEVRGQHPVVVEMEEMVEMDTRNMVGVEEEVLVDILELGELVDMGIFLKQLLKEQAKQDKVVVEVEVEV